MWSALRLASILATSSVVLASACSNGGTNGGGGDAGNGGPGGGTACGTETCAPGVTCDAVAGHCLTARCARASDCPSGQSCDDRGSCTTTCGGNNPDCNGGCCDVDTPTGSPGRCVATCAESSHGSTCFMGRCGGCAQASDCPPLKTCYSPPNFVTPTCTGSCDGNHPCNGGCCDLKSGKCFAGNAAEECGAAGGLCSPCSGSNAACLDGGSCGCRSVSDCSPGLVCNGSSQCSTASCTDAKFFKSAWTQASPGIFGIAGTVNLPAYRYCMGTLQVQLHVERVAPTVASQIDTIPYSPCNSLGFPVSEPYSIANLSAGQYKVGVVVDYNANGTFGDSGDLEGWYDGTLDVPIVAAAGAKAINVAGCESPKDFGLGKLP